MVFYNKSMPGEPLFTPGKYNDYKPNTAEIIRGEPPLCPVVTMIIGLTQPQTIPGEPPLDSYAHGRLHPKVNPR